ncbi:MAG: O-antigen ligase family protein, partial [bacterium]|nr:O-antigen ligase family protein [bacterium]
IVFLYGIMQKFVLFPIYLSRISPEDNFYTQAFITRIKGGRIFSIFPLPTLYAIICTVLILFIFHYMISASKTGKERFLWGTLLLAGLVNLILTQSFGGVLYLTAGGLVYLLVSGILKVKYLVPVIMVLSLFLSITIGLRFSEIRELEPIKFRYSNWKQAARIIEANPLWGAGLGNYEAKIARYTRPGEARSIYAHNFFLQFTAET